MSRRFLFAGLAGIVLFALGCASKPRGAQVRASVPLNQKQPEIYQIIDYKAKEQAGIIPLWVIQYLEEGVWGVEDLPEYGNNYVFIGENTGANRRTLQQWTENFSINQDFARLAAARIEARFSRGAAAYPDDEYGIFFEMMVKAASDTFYEGAVRADDFWILRQYYDADGITVTREAWEFLILVTIDKSLLESQVNAILNGIVPQPPPSREQASAIHRVRDHLFEGF